MSHPNPPYTENHLLSNPATGMARKSANSAEIAAKTALISFLAGILLTKQAENVVALDQKLVQDKLSDKIVSRRVNDF